MSRLALTMAALFVLQGPLCVLHCLASPAEASAAVPSCHAAAASADASAGGPAPAERPDAPLEHCADLAQALSPEGSTLDSGAHVLAVLVPLAPAFSARPAPLPRAPLRPEAPVRVYLATSQLRL